MKPIAISLFMIFTTSAFGLEGVYKGDIELYDSGIKVPLSLSLTIAENIEGSNSIVSSILGAFIVDEEGGPFSFSHVDLDVDEGRLDMKYSRPQESTISGVPSDFRFTGTFTTETEISGTVLSGRRGPIGTFTVAKTNQKYLKRRLKYHGLWSGHKVDRDGVKEKMEISINSTGNHKKNPDNFDFDYTIGKIGFVKFNNGLELGLTKVYIDYLNRRIVMNHESATSPAKLTIEATLGSDRSFESGKVQSTYAGNLGTFSLRQRSEKK